MTQNLDSSWRYVITHAGADGGHFGSGIVFTFGPLGWIFTPVAPSFAQLWVGTLVVVAVYTAGWAAFARLLARPVGGPVAALVVVAVAAVTTVAPPELVAALGTLIVLDRVTRLPAPAVRDVAVLSVLAGVALTGKTGVGELFVALALLLALGVGAASGDRTDRQLGRRFGRALGAVGVSAVGIVAGFAVAWLGTGQRPRDAVAFLRGAGQIQTGYQSAMVVDEPGRGWEWFGAGAGFLLLVAGAFGVVAAAGTGRRWWAAVTAVMAIGATYYLLLQAFVRHGGGHDSTGQTAAVIVVLGWLAGTGRSRTRAVRGAGAAAGAAAPASAPASAPARDRAQARARGLRLTAAVVLFATAVGSAVPTVRPGAFRGRLHALGQDSTLLLHPARVRALAAESLARTRETARIPPAMLAAIGRSTVAPVPWDVNGAVASGLDVTPLPIPQVYSAYTPYLDRLNERALLAPDGPRYVLRQYRLALDGRNPLWESPRAMLALLCGFEQIDINGSYQLLRRSGQRCRVSKVLETVVVPAGTPIVVPRPLAAGAGVVMSVELPRPLRYRIALKLGREPYGGEFYVHLGVGTGTGTGTPTAEVETFRLVPDTADEPLVLQAPPGLWSQVAAGGPPPATVSVTAPGQVRVTFRELVPISG